MKVSYESEELIEEVLEDIALFGEDDEVFAIYSYFEVVDGRKIDAEFITDYFSATEPVRESAGLPWDAEDEQEYQDQLKQWQKLYKQLEQLKYERLTLGELLKRLEEQNRIF